MEDSRFIVFASGNSQQHSGLVTSGTEEGLKLKKKKTKIFLVIFI